MKSTGVVCRVDVLGRVVLPIELRRTMNIQEKDGLEIFTEGDRIILRKYEPGCIFCNEAEDAIEFRGKMICTQCRGELSAVEPIGTW